MNERKKRVRRLRLLSMTAVLGVLTAGMIFGLGTGTLSAAGIKKIYLACPLGYLSTALASRDILFPLFICFLVVVGITILVGRIFCGWVCPVPLLRKVTKNKIDEPNDAFIAGEHLRQEEKLARGVEKVTDKTGKEESGPSDTVQNISETKKQTKYGIPVLIAALASSAVFKFPVFCLICPIGLTFATVFALIRLFGFKDPTLELIIFPAIILTELLILRKWCSKICPLGALLSLISRFNRRLVPTVNRSVCLEEKKGAHCQICRKACPFDIDVKDGTGTGHISECMKCKECSTSCPVNAITFPWKKQKKAAAAERNVAD